MSFMGMFKGSGKTSAAQFNDFTDMRSIPDDETQGDHEYSASIKPVTKTSSSSSRKSRVLQEISSNDAKSNNGQGMAQENRTMKKASSMPTPQKSPQKTPITPQVAHHQSDRVRSVTKQLGKSASQMEIVSPSSRDFLRVRPSPSSSHGVMTPGEDVRFRTPRGSAITIAPYSNEKDMEQYVYKYRQKGSQTHLQALLSTRKQRRSAEKEKEKNEQSSKSVAPELKLYVYDDDSVVPDAQQAGERQYEYEYEYENGAKPEHQQQLELEQGYWRQEETENRDFYYNNYSNNSKNNNLYQQQQDYDYGQQQDNCGGGEYDDDSNNDHQQQQWGYEEKASYGGGSSGTVVSDPQEAYNAGYYAGIAEQKEYNRRQYEQGSQHQSDRTVTTGDCHLYPGSGRSSDYYGQQQQQQQYRYDGYDDDAKSMATGAAEVSTSDSRGRGGSGRYEYDQRGFDAKDGSYEAYNASQRFRAHSPVRSQSSYGSLHHQYSQQQANESPVPVRPSVRSNNNQRSRPLSSHPRTQSRPQQQLSQQQEGIYSSISYRAAPSKSDPLAHSDYQYQQQSHSSAASATCQEPTYYDYEAKSSSGSGSCSQYSGLQQYNHQQQYLQYDQQQQQQPAAYQEESGYQYDYLQEQYPEQYQEQEQQPEYTDYTTSSGYQYPETEVEAEVGTAYGEDNTEAEVEPETVWAYEEDDDYGFRNEHDQQQQQQQQQQQRQPYEYVPEDYAYADSKEQEEEEEKEQDVGSGITNIGIGVHSADKGKERERVGNFVEMDLNATARMSSAEEIETLFSKIRHGHISLVKDAMADGFSPTAVDEMGNTMLHVCCQNNLRKMAAMVIASGCPVNEVNNKGLTPLDYCHQFHFDELGDWMARNHGALPFASGKFNTQLMPAKGGGTSAGGVPIYVDDYGNFIGSPSPTPAKSFR